MTFAYVILRGKDDGSEILEIHKFELGLKECCLKGKYHANLLSFQNPKMFVCQQKQRNNCQVRPSAIKLSISASGQRQSRLAWIET